jgi:hypothetical protein
MKKEKLLTIGFWGLLAVAGTGASSLVAPSARAEKPQDSTCWCTRGGGGEIPTPFGVANRTAELADGEPYTLFGTIVYRQGLAYLQVDFSAHPWLGSVGRRANPYYLIESVDPGLHELEHKTVKILAIARQRLAERAHRIGGGTRSTITSSISLELSPVSGVTPVEGGTSCDDRPSI